MPAELESLVAVKDDSLQQLVEDLVEKEMQEHKKKLETQMQDLEDRKIPEFLLDPKLNMKHSSRLS